MIRTNYPNPTRSATATPVRPVYSAGQTGPAYVHPETEIRSTRTYTRSIRTTKSGESGTIPGIPKPPRTRSIRTNGRTVRTPTGQTGPSTGQTGWPKTNSDQVVKHWYNFLF